MRQAIPFVAAASLAVVVDAARAQDLSHSQIERGRYIATTANCAGCHTDVENDGAPWAGGLEMETPFGPITTPNITFDDETGIGLYSRDEFWNALHNGIRRDGAQLYPAFPYPYFTRMPREDVDALYDYISTIPPVRAAHEPEAGLPAPLRIRAAVRGWNLLHFEPGVFQPDPEKSDEWNRGAYLVDGPAHCGACHTDKHVTGGDRQSEYLRGGTLENWYAPNIRGGENGGLARWSEDDIVEYLGTGRASHTIAMSRMGEVVSLSTQHMTDSDLRSIATYLKDLDDEPRAEADTPDEAIVEAGRTLYFDNCAACHVSDGSGVDHIYAQLDGSNKVNSDDPTTIIRIVLEGAHAEPTDARPAPLGMPAFGWKLSDREVADLLSYVRTAWTNSAPAVSEGDVSALRELLADK